MKKLLAWFNKEPDLNLRLLQWAVPLFLATSALAYELVEHSLEGELHFTLAFMGEVLLFGLMGPVIIGFIIAWMREIVAAERRATALAQELNRDLEARVAARTAELAERNAELARANAELKQLDQLKSDFVSLVSHELRAPLTNLNGGLELALQQADSLPSGARHILQTMVKESERLTGFVQTILNVSRLEAGKLQINPGPVACVPLLQRTVEAMFPDQRRPIEWNIAADLPPLWADEVYLEETVRNILRNADKYAPANSPILITAHLHEGQAQISIGDHGPGIPAEIQPYIFERFYRGQRGDSAAPGWGLGLYFARCLMEIQGGAINLRSPWRDAPDHPGAEFTLTLPIAAVPEGEDDV